jgi:hypothetical protein
VPVALILPCHLLLLLLLLQRRLLLGAVGIAGVAAFGLIPTQQLQIAKPNKPLFFYIVPLLRYGWG